MSYNGVGQPTFSGGLFSVFKSAFITPIGPLFLFNRVKVQSETANPIALYIGFVIGILVFTALILSIEIAVAFAFTAFGVNVFSLDMESIRAVFPAVMVFLNLLLGISIIIGSFRSKISTAGVFIPLRAFSLLIQYVSAHIGISLYEKQVMGSEISVFAGNILPDFVVFGPIDMTQFVMAALFVNGGQLIAAVQGSKKT